MRQGLKRGDLLQELHNIDQASSTEHREKAPQNQSFRGQNGAVLGLESTQGRKLSRSDELISKQDSRAVLQHEDSISSTTGLEKPSGGNCTCEQRQPSPLPCPIPTAGRNFSACFGWRQVFHPLDHWKKNFSIFTEFSIFISFSKSKKPHKEHLPVTARSKHSLAQVCVLIPSLSRKFQA